MNKSLLAIAVIFLTATNTSLADDIKKDPLDDALKLDTIVVTANRDIQPREQTNALVTVFTRKDIDRLQPSSVTDLLSRVPGVQITQAGGKGSVTGLFIRGTKAAQNLVLIDGQRVGSASTGAAALQYLAVDQIERVEVLRGSRSAIYGSDAIGGVIQIFTRRGESEGLHPRLRIAMGNRGTWQGSLGLSGGTAQTRFSLNAALDETQGIDRTRKSWSADKDHDAYRNKSYSFTLSHAFSDDLEVGLNALDQRGKSEYDNPFGRYQNYHTYPSKPYIDYDNSSISGYLNYHLNDVWTTRLETGHAEDKERTKDKLYKPANDSYNTFKDTVTWLNTLNLDEHNTLLIGADYLNDKLHSSTHYDRTSRWNRGGFIQHSYQGEFVFTEVGYRHDKNQQFGSKETWNGSLGFNINSANKLILSYAEGFRVPTFNDLYYPADYYSKPNPNLKPEESKSYEIQWRSQLAEKTYLETSVYHTIIKDMINYQSDPVTYVGSSYNVDKARINGLEANLHQEFWGWQGVMGLSVIDPRDAKTGHTLQNRARRTLNIDLDRQIGNFSIGMSWLAVSSSYGDSNNSINIPGYGLLGVRGSWQITPEVKLDAKIDNMFDKSYYRTTYSYQNRTYGYREEGITTMLGFTWTPKIAF